MSEVAFIEKYPQNKKSTVAIKPFFNGLVENMGLEKYNLSLFDGVFHEEPLACLEIHGVKRYLTGLNEFAPELKALPDDEREAKIKQIRIVVAQLEKELASNEIDPKDKEFWNKVKLLRPDNSTFWDNIKIRCGNDPVFLDPTTDPLDLIKLYAIEAGGFSMVGKSLEAARKSDKTPKFYLDRLEETASSNTEVKKLRNKAVSSLEDLFNMNTAKLFYVAKVIDPLSTQYKKSTPTDVLYDNMDKYINGETVEKDKRKTAQKFIEISAMDMETLKIRAMIKDATFFKIIVTKPDGFIYHGLSGAMMGRTPSDVLEFLKNPLHEDVLKDITLSTEKYWNA